MKIKDLDRLFFLLLKRVFGEQEKKLERRKDYEVVLLGQPSLKVSLRNL